MTIFFDLPDDIIKQFDLGMDKVCFSLTCKRFYKVFGNCAKTIPNTIRLKNILNFKNIEYSKFWFSITQPDQNFEKFHLFGINILGKILPIYNDYITASNHFWYILSSKKMSKYAKIIPFHIPQFQIHNIYLLQLLLEFNSKEYTMMQLYYLIYKSIIFDDLNSYLILENYLVKIDYKDDFYKSSCNKSKNIANYIINKIDNKELINSKIIWINVGYFNKNVLFNLLFLKTKRKIDEDALNNIILGSFISINEELINYLNELGYIKDNQKRYFPLIEAIGNKNIEKIKELIPLFKKEKKHFPFYIERVAFDTEEKFVISLICGEEEQWNEKYIKRLSKIVDYNNIFKTGLDKMLSSTLKQEEKENDCFRFIKKRKIL